MIIFLHSTKLIFKMIIIYNLAYKDIKNKK